MAPSTPPHKRVPTLPEKDKNFYDFFAVDDDVHYSKLLYQEDPPLPLQPKQETTRTIPPPESLLQQPQPVSQRTTSGAIVPYYGVRDQGYRRRGSYPQIIVNNYNTNIYVCNASCKVAENPTVDSSLVPSGDVAPGIKQDEVEPRNQIVIGEGEEGKEQEEENIVTGHWTKEEHRLFLKGLAKYGRGKWRLIKQEFFPNRRVDQIASHAQKHRDHLNDSNKKNSSEKKRKRRSIFQMEEEKDQNDPKP